MRSISAAAASVGILAMLFLAEGKAPANGTVIIMRPPTTSGEEGKPTGVKGKNGKVEKSAVDPVTFDIATGKYLVYSAESAKPIAALRVDSNQTVYFVNERDAASQRRLADMLFEAGNRTAALSLYRTAVGIDTSMGDAWKRYAELAAETGNVKEATAALQRVMKMGIADARTFRALGDMYVAAGKHAEATTMYERALDKGGDNAAVLAGLGAAKLKTGDPAGAIVAYQGALRLQPDSIRHHRALGDAHLARKDTASAIASYKTFFDKGGSDNAAALTMGAYDYRQRRFENAAKYLSLVNGTAAQAFDCLYLLGESYFRLGNFAEAGTVLRTAANKYPKAKTWPDIVEMLINSYVALNDLGKARFWIDRYAKATKGQNPDIAYLRAYLQEKGSPAKAQAQYEKNIVAFPADHRNFLRLGLITAKSKATAARSLELLRKAVSLADTIPEAWLEISRVYRQLDRPSDELAALRVFVASDPQHPEANARIGELMLGQGKTGEALQRLEVAQKAGSEDPAVLIALAKGYANSGRTPEAIQALEKAKAKSPNNIEIRRGLVDLYQRTSATDKVLEELKGILAVQPDPPTLLIYAQRLYDAGKFRDALDALEDIRATDPANTDALMLLGKVHRAEKNFQGAIEIYQELLSIQPAYAPALYERAKTHLEAGQPHWAEEFYDRTLKADPKFALAELGLAEVSRLRKDKTGFQKHLEKARRMEPGNRQIQQAAARGF